MCWSSRRAACTWSSQHSRAVAIFTLCKASNIWPAASIGSWPPVIEDSVRHRSFIHTVSLSRIGSEPSTLDTNRRSSSPSISCCRRWRNRIATALMVTRSAFFDPILLITRRAANRKRCRPLCSASGRPLPERLAHRSSMLLERFAQKEARPRPGGLAFAGERLASSLVAPQLPDDGECRNAHRADEVPDLDFCIGPSCASSPSAKHTCPMARGVRMAPACSVAVRDWATAGPGLKKA
mmetsp:Transcript_84152/g.242976  ORF Transcript_84152/g.242976 Transcript_84152/m.242976 type:complete len:238 (+) Transcript_84152:457-1170(+)